MKKPLGAKELQVRALREANAAAARTKARPSLSQLRKTMTDVATGGSKPSTAPVPASAQSQEKTMNANKTKTSKSKPKKPSGKKRSVSEAAANLRAARAAAKVKTPAKEPKEPKADPKPKAAGGIRPGSKLEIVANLLKRPEGCTTADVLAATEWPAVSMPQMAKSAGLVLAKEKVDGVTRYRGSAPEAA